MSITPPRVSVVISVRNEERFVAQAVTSILAQTMKDLELIVVDNASADGTPDILATLARPDARLRILRHDAEVDLGTALNIGCGEARSPLIARMDGDDVALPGRLERQVAYLTDHPAVALVGGAAIVIDDTGKGHHTLRPPTGDADVRASLAERNCLIHPTVMMRRNALREVGGYRAGFAHAEDYDLWLRLAERHQLANLPDVVLHYRVHPRQISHRAIEQQVLSALAAQAAARRRRAGFDDGPAGDRRITLVDLVELGVTEDAVRDAVAKACLHRAADLGDLDRSSLAAAMLASTPGFATSEEVCRRTLARYHALLARRQWRRGQLGRSLASALRAVHARPALLRQLVRGWSRAVKGSVAPQGRT